MLNKILKEQCLIYEWHEPQLQNVSIIISGNGNLSYDVTIIIITQALNTTLLEYERWFWRLLPYILYFGLGALQRYSILVSINAFFLTIPQVGLTKLEPTA